MKLIKKYILYIYVRYKYRGKKNGFVSYECCQTKMGNESFIDVLNEEYAFMKVKLRTASDAVQYIRFTQTDKNSDNSYSLVLSYFDIYGKLDKI